MLNKRITFFDFNEVSDGAGGFESTEFEVLETWASVAPVKSVKTLEALKEAINKAFLIKIRSRQGFVIKSRYKVVTDGRTLSILTIEEEKGFIILTAVSRED